MTTSHRAAPDPLPWTPILARGSRPRPAVPAPSGPPSVAGAHVVRWRRLAVPSSIVDELAPHPRDPPDRPEQEIPRPSRSARIALEHGRQIRDSHVYQRTWARRSPREASRAAARSCGQCLSSFATAYHVVGVSASARAQAASCGRLIAWAASPTLRDDARLGAADRSNGRGTTTVAVPRARGSSRARPRRSTSVRRAQAGRAGRSGRSPCRRPPARERSIGRSLLDPDRPGTIDALAHAGSAGCRTSIDPRAVVARWRRGSPPASASSGVADRHDRSRSRRTAIAERPYLATSAGPRRNAWSIGRRPRRIDEIEWAEVAVRTADAPPPRRRIPRRPTSTFSPNRGWPAASERRPEHAEECPPRWTPQPDGTKRRPMVVVDEVGERASAGSCASRRSACTVAPTARPSGLQQIPSACEDPLARRGWIRMPAPTGGGVSKRSTTVTS